MISVQLSEMTSLADRIAANLTEATETAVRSLALRVGERLRTSTPHLTGRAEQSWVPFVGTPPALPRAGKRRSRGTARGTLRVSLGGVQFLQGGSFEEVFGNWHLSQGILGVILTVPYGQKLAAGKSPQQPAGWIEALAHDEVAQAQEGA